MLNIQLNNKLSTVLKTPCDHHRAVPGTDRKSALLRLYPLCGELELSVLTHWKARFYVFDIGVFHRLLVDLSLFCLRTLFGLAHIQGAGNDFLRPGFGIGEANQGARMARR